MQTLPTTFSETSGLLSTHSEIVISTRSPPRLRIRHLSFFYTFLYNGTSKIPIKIYMTDPSVASRQKFPVPILLFFLFGLTNLKQDIPAGRSS